MTNIDKKHETALPATANTKEVASPAAGDKSQDKVAKPETATPAAPKKDPEVKPAVTAPTHKNA